LVTAGTLAKVEHDTAKEILVEPVAQQPQPSEVVVRDCRRCLHLDTRDRSLGGLDNEIDLMLITGTEMGELNAGLRPARLLNISTVAQKMRRLSALKCGDRADTWP
jgi:hypothetical protein